MDNFFMVSGILLYIFAIFVGMFALTIPSIYITKKLSKKSYKKYWKILLVMLLSIMNFLLILVAFGLVVLPISDVDTAYESGSMFFMFIFCSFPVVIGVFLINVIRVLES